MYIINMDIANMTMEHRKTDDILFCFLIARCCLSAFIIVGSGLTITAVCRYKRLRTTSNRVILSLTVADLLGALLNFALIGLHYLKGNHLWNPLCMVEETLDLLSSGGVIVSVTLIAIDRYIHVVKYLNYQQVVTPSRLYAALICAWLYVALAASGIMVFSNQLTSSDKCSWTLLITPNIYYYFILPHVGVFTVIIVTMYSLIGHFLYKQRCTMLKHKKSAGQKVPSLWSNSRTNSTIAIVVLAYFAAAFPTLILSMLVNSDSPFALVMAKEAAILLWYNIAVANPAIYLWRNPDFKWAFHQMSCVQTDNDVQDTDISSTRMTAATITQEHKGQEASTT